MTTIASPPLTTGQISRLTGCAARTVAKWIDNKLLPGWRLPGGDRRVERHVFDNFVVQHNMLVLPYSVLNDSDDDPDPPRPPVAEAALDAAETRRAA